MSVDSHGKNVSKKKKKIQELSEKIFGLHGTEKRIILLYGLQFKIAQVHDLAFERFVSMIIRLIIFINYSQSRVHLYYNADTNALQCEFIISIR